MLMVCTPGKKGTLSWLIESNGKRNRKEILEAINYDINLITLQVHWRAEPPLGEMWAIS
ncbi:Uncharacterized protein APZ42_031317 [Daphnia magna]|uniref:Uncharacterized protein n=1 Tax=Daphnia magna TaxID=35525 RepID=A0A164MYN6_9CRUS|nr:Uncharacterized protein APZ42_031317 [Daphnia magna]